MFTSPNMLPPPVLKREEHEEDEQQKYYRSVPLEETVALHCQRLAIISHIIVV